MTDAYQAHVNGLHMIHGVLRTALASALKHSTTVPPQFRASYLRYLRAYHDLLLSHHDHEEEIEFPVFKSKMPAIDQFEEEHHKLTALLSELKALSDDTKAAEYDAARTERCLRELQDLMIPHLAGEEKEVTVEKLRAKFTVEEVQEVDAKIQAALKKHDGTIVVPIMYYNMDKQARDGVWVEVFPWILRTVIFPFFLARKHKDMWQFAAFPPQ
ncbi:hypothetical protein HDV00_010584 [Rhizophlyctis rosea]|nr:hypothetical protein HDV00_010584 [Rhizophlyctis rosea]